PPILDALAHADNAAAADLDAGAADACQGVEPVLVGPRGDDLAIELWRGIEIVVVGGEPRFGEAIGLRLAQHAEGDAGLHAELPHPAHHGEHVIEGFPVLYLAPG